MKKVLTISCLLFSITSFSQTKKSVSKKQGGYVSFRGGFSPKDGDAKGIASLSVGACDKNNVAFGFGIGYINYKSPYIPITLDFSFFGIRRKISPVAVGQVGYGVYNYSAYGTTVRGGFTGSINVGISFPAAKNNRVYLAGGYYSYRFIATSRISGSTKQAVSSENRFAILFGIKI